MTQISTCRIARFAAWAAIGLACIAATPASRAKAEVYPSLALGLSYSDNLGYTIDDFEQSDTATSLGFRLPVVWARRTGATTLTFQGTYYKQSGVSSLDRFNWGAALAHGITASKQTQLTFLAAFVHTQAQGDPQNLDDTEIFLTRRSERDLAQLSLDVHRKLLRRWNWSFGLEAQSQSNKEIADFDAMSMIPSTGESIEDKTQYGANTGLSRQFNERVAFGAQMSYRRYELEASGMQDTASLGLTVSRVLNEISSFNVFAGGYRSTGEAADGTGTDDENQGYQVGVGYTRTIHNLQMDLGLSRAPSSGGSQAGTATQSTASVSVSNRRSLHWDWRASLQQGLREPSDPSQADRTSTALNFILERVIGRTLGFNIGTTAVQLTTDDPDIENRESVTVNAGLVWYPRGRQSPR